MNCTRCQKPLKRVWTETDIGSMHPECGIEYITEKRERQQAKLRADRDRLLAACKAALIKLKYSPVDRVSVAYEMIEEAIRLAEKEE